MLLGEGQYTDAIKDTNAGNWYIFAQPEARSPQNLTLNDVRADIINTITQQRQCVECAYGGDPERDHDQELSGGTYRPNSTVDCRDATAAAFAAIGSIATGTAPHRKREPGNAGNKL